MTGLLLTLTVGLVGGLVAGGLILLGMRALGRRHRVGREIHRGMEYARIDAPAERGDYGREWEAFLATDAGKAFLAARGAVAARPITRGRR